MTLRVVGAGLPRTGTLSLKGALETLLGGRCYHMIEVFGRPEDVPTWHAAVRGEDVDWRVFFDGWTAAVDWPVSAFWREIAGAHPEAIVLLSQRDSPESWLRSVNDTVGRVFVDGPTDDDQSRAWFAMVDELRSTRFGELNTDDALRAYERHNAAVRESVPPDRLLEWRPGDGWGPICEALGVPVPDEPFPHVNTTEEFQGRSGR